MRVEHLTLAHGDKVVLSDFSLDIPPGITALNGPSGCGKTSLLRAIAGLFPPQGGQIVDIDPKQVALLFQENRLFPQRTAAQHISDVLPKDRHGEVERWLKVADLWSERTYYPAALSGGMQRRLALVRTLALGGQLYLLDEPFTGVDLPRIIALMDLIRSLHVPVLLTTHEKEVLTLSDHVLSL